MQRMILTEIKDSGMEANRLALLFTPLELGEGKWNANGNYLPSPS